MTTTIEISFYPLNKDYPSSVVGFLQKLRGIQAVEVNTNGMSTILTGSYEQLWPSLGELINGELQKEDCVFVMKIAPGRREYVD